MNALNCPRCGRLFVKVKAPVCAACEKAEAEAFDRVRDYVKENPDRPITEVSEVCEVPVKRILQYVRDGRLEASKGMQGEVVCSKCGIPINTGLMCEKCIAEMGSTVNEMVTKNKETAKPQGVRMHTKY